MRFTDRRGLFVSAVLAACILSHCAPHPFQAPSVLAGDDSTVSIAAGKGTDTHAFAAAYCLRHGKGAVYLGSTTLNETAVTRLYAYDCKAGHR